MKYLVDTCGWIEWLIDGKKSEKFERYLKRSQNLIVPTIIQFELFKWVCREKSEELALEVIGMTEQAIVVPLTTDLVLAAAEVSSHHKLVMADAIIYAAALQNHATLITSDSHFKNLSDIIFIQKD